MFECTHLIIPHDGGDDSSSKTGCDADADATDRTANGDVPNHIVLAIPDGRWGEGGERGRRKDGLWTEIDDDA